MDALTGYISAHPAILVIGSVLFIILFLNFTFKSLFKFILIILFILLAVFVFYSFNDSDKNKESTEMMQSVMDDLKDKSKSFFKDSKELYKKSKDAPEEVDKLLDASDKEVEKELKRNK